MSVKKASVWPSFLSRTSVKVGVLLLLTFFITGYTLVQPLKHSLPGSKVQVAHAQDEGNDEDNKEEDNSCESVDGLIMGWIMCPIISMIDGTINFLETQIQRLLEVDETKYNNEGLRKAWTQFRNIAYIILIPIMLVMVISTALGFEAFSAYTVKKALPRMVIAIIFITLSWYICQLLIGFTNVVGTGVGGLVTQPFKADVAAACQEVNSDGEVKGLTLSCIFGPASSNGVLNVIIGAATGIIAGIGLIVILWFFGITLLLAIGTAFLILLTRQIFIIALILLAPLAILAWIFPGNDKMWKLWWGTFTKLLLMFPLIMLLIAVGKVFALLIHLSADAGGDGAVLSNIFILLAYMLPFAFIPFTFKLAGGAFATVAGFVNDKEKGLFDRQKQKRAEKWGNVKTGTDQSIIGRNRAVRAVGTRIGAGAGNRYGFGARGRQALDQNARLASVESVMKDPKWNGINQNDDALWAATYKNAQEAQEKLTEKWGDADRAKRAVASVRASVGFGRPQAIAAAQQLVSTGTGYDNMQDMVSTLARASGGNASTESALAGFANSETKKVGRHDLAPGFGDLDKAVRATNGNLRIDPETGKQEVAPSMSQLSNSAWQSASLYEHANDKPKNLEAHIKHFEKELASNDPAKQEAAAVFFTELRAMKPNAKGGNATIINDALEKNSVSIENAVRGLPASTPMSPETTKPVYQTVVDPSGAKSRVQVATRAETGAERVERLARTYERVDPNHLD